MFMLNEHIKNIKNEITEYKKAMDDDFTFKEEKGDQAGGPETSKVDRKQARWTGKVDQKHGMPSYVLYPRTQASLHAKRLTNWASTGAPCLSILRKCKTTTSFTVRVHRSPGIG